MYTTDATAPPPGRSPHSCASSARVARTRRANDSLVLLLLRGTSRESAGKANLNVMTFEFLLLYNEKCNSRTKCMRKFVGFSSFHLILAPKVFVLVFVNMGVMLTDFFYKPRQFFFIYQDKCKRQTTLEY